MCCKLWLIILKKQNLVPKAMLFKMKALLITIPLLVHAAALAKPCCLCDDCIAPMVSESNAIKVDVNKTCLDVAVEAVTIETEQCRQVQQQYRATCCLARERSLQVQQQLHPKPEAASKYAKGNHPVCT